MNILGIDPGYDRCGFAVMDAKGRLQHFGVISTSSKKPFLLRQSEIAEDFLFLLKRFSIALVAIEDLFFARNITTALKVAQIRGVLSYLAITHHCKVIEPKPSEIKKFFCGNGQASKGEMIQMAHRLYALPAIARRDDAIDAIAIAAFAAHQWQMHKGRS